METAPGVPARKLATAPVDADRFAPNTTTPATEPAGKVAETGALSDLAARELKLSTNTPAPTAAPMPSLAPAAESKAVAPSTPLATATDLTAQRLRDLTSGPGLVTSGEVEELQKRMRSTLGGEANAAFNLEPRSSLYLIVQTPDAAATSGQVAAYFKANNIQYMNYEGPPIDLGGGTDALAKITPNGGADTDLAKGGALGGGLSSPSQVGGRSAARAQPTDRAAGGSYGGFGGGGGASGPRQQASADARRGAEAGAAARETLTQKQENFGRAAAPATQPDNERLYRRGLVRDEDLVAQSPVATSRPSVALSAAPKPTGEGAALDVSSEARLKAKTDASPPALGDKAGDLVKDELSLGMKTAGPAVPPVTSAGGVAQPTHPEAGQTTQAYPPLGRGRFVPGDTNWSMRLGGPDGKAARGGVIVARMNRRQANELGLALSREQGQRAELRDLSEIAGTAVVGKPAAAPTDAPGAAGATDKAATIVAEKPAADALRLTSHPQDEPVDVVIVVKPETATPPAASAKSEADTKK
jgi:hypothetical protein